MRLKEREKKAQTLTDSLATIGLEGDKRGV
jgi:hypothetical protein